MTFEFELKHNYFLKYSVQINIANFKQFTFPFYKQLCIFTGCAMGINKPSLDPSVNCHLLHTCTGVRCCVHASLLKRNYEIYFNIDHCTSSLSLQIDQVYHNQTLAGFNWGMYSLYCFLLLL